MANDMRILFLSQYFPPEMGAPSARTYEVCRRWVEKGAQVTVVTGFPHHPTGIIPEQYKGYKFLREHIDGITVIRTYVFATANKGFLKRIISYISFMFSSILQGVKSSGKQDILIATSPQFFVGIAGFIMSRLKKIPFVFEVRDLWPESIKQLGQITNPILINFLETIEMFLYKKSIHIVGVADSTVKILTERGIPKYKISIVKNGVDLKLFNIIQDGKEIREKYNFFNKFIVSYIGTLGLSHALEHVLQTAQFLEKEIIFLLIGEGAEKNKLQKMAREMDLANVRFIDQVSKEELPAYYAASNVVLVTLKDLPLFQCVIPSKIFEIMAMGKPIIISVKGESRKLVVEDANAGIAAIPENHEDLADKIIDLYHNKDVRNKFGQNGRAFVEKYFDRNQLADRYLDIIKGLL
jgi:glycosyltransferase involved in cell wall biosynthesis